MFQMHVCVDYLYNFIHNSKNLTFSKFTQYTMSKTIPELEREILKWSSTSISSGLVDISVHSNSFKFTLKFNNGKEQTFECDNEIDRQKYVCIIIYLTKYYSFGLSLSLMKVSLFHSHENVSLS